MSDRRHSPEPWSALIDAGCALRDWAAHEARSLDLRTQSAQRLMVLAGNWNAAAEQCDPDAITSLDPERVREQLARYSECPDPDCGGIVQHDGAHHYCATCHVRAAARINESALQGTFQREREAVREVVEKAKALCEYLPRELGMITWTTRERDLAEHLRTALARLEEKA